MMRMKYLFFSLFIIVVLSASLSGCKLPGLFPDQESMCQFDEEREKIRRISAERFPSPEIQQILVNGKQQWTIESKHKPEFHPGDLIELRGTGFGQGVDIDFSKIMLGNSRVLETDLKMFQQELAIQDQVNYEIPVLHDTWNKDVIIWQDDKIKFTVPSHVSGGPLILQVQKRTGYLNSLKHPDTPHNVLDAQSSRIIDENEVFQFECDVVSQLSNSKWTTPIDITVVNPEFDQLVAKGRQVFWSYDFNIGLAHSVRNLNWENIFKGKANDPIVGGKAINLEQLFGAYKTREDQVPDDAIEDVFFDPYPMENPIPGFLTTEEQLIKGNTQNTGYAGYRYAQSSSPFKGKGQWAGFNCASCHGYKIQYEQSPGHLVTRVFPGLPNPNWSMKWTVLQTPLNIFDGIYTDEEGPQWSPGNKAVAKDMLLYYVPQGTGEHNLVRVMGEGSTTDNDYQFSPIAIPNVTNYMSIRRSLSHTESYVGFEGSYIHSEEPDGAMGSMKTSWLKALTAYMTQLNQDDEDLINVGLYRWLKQNNKLQEATQQEILSEGEFVSLGWQSYQKLNEAVNRGKTYFEDSCIDCHHDGFGAHSSEKMIRLDKVGRFFAPTIYQKEVQSIRTAFLRNLYWVQNRGLLSDGHVRNLEDLINPQRCNKGTELYNQYYTLHKPVRPALGSVDQPLPYPDVNRKGDVFRIPKSQYHTTLDKGYKRNRFIERHKYFVQVPWDSEYYYWDFQKMRTQYGPDEMGTEKPISMPDSPHPWCANSEDKVNDLVQYLLTL